MRTLILLSACSLACGSGSGTGDPTEDAGTGDAGVSYEDCLPECDVPYADFFDRDRLATLRLDFDTERLAAAGYAPEEWLDMLWDRWYHCGPYDNYEPVTFTYEAGGAQAVLEGVGIRNRGGADEARREGDRVGFKLHFSKMLPEPPKGEPRRHFADLNRMNLVSVEGDETVMIQCLAYQMLADYEVQAPLCNHMRVFVNGEYYGLMQNVEEPDDGRFLRHHFADNDGTLYEGNHGCGFTNDSPLRYAGPTFAGSDYETTYSVEAGDVANAEAEIIPMLQCADADTTPDDGDFATCIAEWIDVDQWLRLIAAEMVMPSLESFSGAGRNFYLYFLPDKAAPHGGRFVAYSWDLDHAYRGSCVPEDCDVFSAVPGWHYPNEAPVLITRLRTVFFAEFCQHLRNFYADVFTADRVDARAAVIHDAMVPGGQFAETDPLIEPAVWEDDVGDLRYFIDVARPAELDLQLAACP